MKITHIGPDTQFLAFAAEIFEAVSPGNNEFLVLGQAGEATLKFPIPSERVRIVQHGIRGLRQVWLAARDSNIVIAHSMGLHGALGFAGSPSESKTVWSGWGGDYYGSDTSRDSGLLGASTLELSKSLSATFGKAKSLAKGRVRGAIRRQAARRTNFFSAPIPEDFEIFKARFPQFSGAYSQLNYASVEETFAAGTLNPNAHDVLVGNSASFANNHLEVFDLLARHDFSGRRVIVPLNYGDDPSYGAAVLRKGAAAFGSAFTPLVDYLPLDQYLSIIGQCSVVVMGHKRQQALGNIGAALYHGAHVYLDPSSPAFEFFRSRGAVINTTRSLTSGDLPSTQVEDAVLRSNRHVLEEFWGRERVLENVKALIDRSSSQL